MSVFVGFPEKINDNIYIVIGISAFLFDDAPTCFADRWFIDRKMDEVVVCTGGCHRTFTKVAIYSISIPHLVCYYFCEIVTPTFRYFKHFLYTLKNKNYYYSGGTYQT